ncbi:MAG: 4-deoxy-4-formamido-L-arabinose-phosphoundecaprenol deformylase [Proteobacteria bacterium]|nr:4-deoxy-4-formamido-L-arabinose-phosphoundecaprenol deformylase [Pseudomonadota bacterium]
MKLGLRIDVDTLRGTRMGVPALGRILEDQGVKASFFFSVGPDNMGRNLFRLLKPAFLMKMLRSKAASLYGWDILLMGTFWPGPIIGKHCHKQIRMIADMGHEIGIHAWDHYTWQAHILKKSKAQVHGALSRGTKALTEITGKAPTCSAAPGWIANDTVLEAKELFSFLYNSDCRGHSPFYPLVQGKALGTPQIPVTLPTYDEIIGKEGIGPDNYNESLLSMIRPDQLNVLTIHAEVEGIVCQQMFRDFMEKARHRNIDILPLGKLLGANTIFEKTTLIQQEITGREGRVAVQTPSPRII